MTFSRRSALFGTYCLVVAIANWGGLSSLLELARHDMTASHVVLIPFASMGLVYTNRVSVFSSVRWDRWAGLAVLTVAAFVLIAATGATSFTLSISAVVLFWIGGFVLFYGREASRAALFPLAFLAFTIPIPTPLLNAAVLFLKKGSAETVAELFTLARAPYFREGFVFNLPNVAIEIADDCSGIRSSIALVLTSMIAGHLLLKSTWQQAALIAVAIPIAIVKNGIRIVSLTLLAIHYDPGFLTGRLHHEGGVVFFMVGLMILLPVVGLLHRLETARTIWISKHPKENFV